MHALNTSAETRDLCLTKSSQPCYAGGMLRYVLLGLLADGKPAHGYALMKAYWQRAGVRLSIGNVYRELQRLMAEQCIVTVANPAGADPRRAPYAITDVGREKLKRWLSQSAHLLTRPQPDELSHRLALIGDMDPELAARLLDDVHDELWRRAKILERERAAAECKERDPDELGTLATLGVLLARQARHLSVDIELVAEMRTSVSASLKRHSKIATPPGASSERKSARSAKRVR
jgi:DNA-binding PadR family transcriptional regulator